MIPNRQIDIVRPEPELLLAVAEARIAWVLDRPETSAWLKQALRTADGVDPVALQNDIEMIRHLLSPRCQVQIELALGAASVT